MALADPEAWQCMRRCAFRVPSARAKGVRLAASARQPVLAVEIGRHADHGQAHEAEQAIDAPLLAFERQIVEIHAEKADQEIERQKDGGHQGQVLAQMALMRSFALVMTGRPFPREHFAQVSTASSTW